MEAADLVLFISTKTGKNFDVNRSILDTNFSLDESLSLYRFIDLVNSSEKFHLDDDSVERVYISVTLHLEDKVITFFDFAKIWNIEGNRGQ